MPTAGGWCLERYRDVLRLQVRQVLHRDSRYRRYFDSSDLVQDTFRKAHQGLGQFRGETEAELLKWLQRILVNTLRDKLRALHAQNCDVDLERSLDQVVAESSAHLQDFLASRDPSPAEQAERNEQLRRVAAAIEQLPEEQRDVVIERDLLGATVEDIAARLGRTRKSVAGLLFRGRRRLRELLGEME